MDAVIHRYKVPLLLCATAEIGLPEGGIIRSIEHYKGCLSIWVQTYRDAPTRTRKIYLAGTGITIPEEVAKQFNYLGTVIQVGEVLPIPLVYHIFISD